MRITTKLQSFGGTRTTQRTLLCMVFLGCLGVRGLSQTTKPSIETELMLGPSVSTGSYVPNKLVNDVRESYTDYGVALGVGAQLNLHRFEGGALFFSAQPSIVFGWSESFDITAAHLPFGVGLKMGNGEYGAEELSAGFTFGHISSIVFGKQFSLQPYTSIDLTAGVFSRGALQIRYLFTLSTQENMPNHQMLMLVFNTGW